ncbi:MAG: TraV family lipoprotein [Pseudomonadota bacterium]
MNCADLRARIAVSPVPRALTLTATLLLSGCVNMSGIDGGSEYGCKAPRGVQCNSVSGNYYNALQNNLPGQRKERTTSAPVTTIDFVSRTTTARRNTGGASVAATDASSISGESNAIHTTSPLRSPGRELRLWFKPWEDADHDLYDQGYVYVRIDEGRWLIEHAQQRIRDTYAPVRPPRSSATRTGAGARSSGSIPSDAAGASGDTGPSAMPPRPGPGGAAAINDNE